MKYWNAYLRYWENIGGRYFMVAGIAFVLFYILLRTIAHNKKIQHKYPRIKDYAREIGYSVMTISIFSLIPVIFVINPVISPHTTMYRNIGEYGIAYYIFAYPLMFIMHDTYFYWVHRLMHHKKIFPYFHLVHHQSTNPSPWAAYAFHPLEALVEAGIFVIFLFTIPMHTSHFYIFFFLSIVYNVYGHLGWELYPKGFSKNFIGKWINTSVNHNQHHQHFKGNYGLYFLFWDRLMGTIRKDYDQKFEEVKKR